MLNQVNKYKKKNGLLFKLLSWIQRIICLNGSLQILSFCRILWLIKYILNIIYSINICHMFEWGKGGDYFNINRKNNLWFELKQLVKQTTIYFVFFWKFDVVKQTLCLVRSCKIWLQLCYRRFLMFPMAWCWELSH